MIAQISQMFGAIVVGISLGSILLTLAKKYQKKKLGYTAFFLCIVCHFVLGFVFSLPCFAIMFALILKNTNIVELEE